ncbi:MAG: hypothetical protein LBT64_02960 [Puniceicoccales bacterium]|nr:hypothetical protein [Puniceicoccales bacterium]
MDINAEFLVSTPDVTPPREGVSGSPEIHGSGESQTPPSPIATEHEIVDNGDSDRLTPEDGKTGNLPLENRDASVDEPADDIPASVPEATDGANVDAPEPGIQPQEVAGEEPTPITDIAEENPKQSVTIPSLLEQIGGDVRTFLMGSSRKEIHVSRSGNNSCGFDSIVANLREKPELEVKVLRKKTQLPDGIMFESDRIQVIADHYGCPFAIITRNGEQFEYAIPGMDRLILIRNSEQVDLSRNFAEWLSEYVSASENPEQLNAVVDEIIGKIIPFLPAEFNAKSASVIDVLIGLHTDERTIVLLHEGQHFTPAVHNGERIDLNSMISERRRRQEEQRQQKQDANPTVGPSPSSGGSSAGQPTWKPQQSIPFVHPKLDSGGHNVKRPRPIVNRK